jgi:peptidoglycan/LPS O-acetylase OafA/YrhL
VKRNLKELFMQPRQTGLTILDGIRAIGIIWVMGNHTLWVLSWAFWGEQQYSDLRNSLFLRGIVNADVAVDMFFVLSGFLIAHLLAAEFDKTGKIDVLRFYWRRWLRIFPTYGLVLAAFWIPQYFYTSFCDNCNFCHYYGWSNILFVNNFASPFFATCMIWTWSIAVEVHCVCLLHSWLFVSLVGSVRSL